MTRKPFARRGLALAGPVAVLIAPKCPLCLMSLFAMAGVAIPAGPALQIAFIAVIIGWLLLLRRGLKGWIPLAIAIMGAALVIAGRFFPFAPATWIGVILMGCIAVFRMRSRDRVCAGGCAAMPQ
jgi:hypothetical protein